MKQQLFQTNIHDTKNEANESGSGTTVKYNTMKNSIFRTQKPTELVQTKAKEGSTTNRKRK